MKEMQEYAGKLWVEYMKGSLFFCFGLAVGGLGSSVVPRELPWLGARIALTVIHLVFLLLSAFVIFELRKNHLRVTKEMAEERRQRNEDFRKKWGHYPDEPPPIDKRLLS